MPVDIDINTMDITGIDSLFKREVIPFRIYKANQIIDLEEPVYATSIVVQILSGEDLVAYANFSVGDTDDTSISKAKYAQEQLDPGTLFTENLTKSIVVTGYTGTEFTIYVTYQALYKNNVSITDDMLGPTYTPGLMRSVLNRLTYLTNVLPPIPDITEGTVNTIQVLAEDLTGLNNDNYIQDEIHMQVNTLANRFIVRPANGSFYKHDLVIKFNDVTLVENVDYEVTGINLGKTRVSSHDSGVYDYIRFLKSIAAGIVTISYRAFGGAICPLTINQVKSTLANIVEYIKLGGFITSDSLQAHPIIVSIIDRIITIENMLHISAPITYSYVSDTIDSWVNIAQIEADPDSGLVNTTGVGHFRIRCGKYFTELKLNYDLNSARELDAHIISSWGTTLEQDGYSYFNNRICPKFRILWDSDSVNSGIILQMSITSNSNRTLSVEIQNTAGVFGNWSLLETDGTPLTPVTTITTLPDDSTWDNSNPNCRASNSPVACGKSYTIYVGTIPTNILDTYTYTDIELADPQDNSSPIQEKLPGLLVAPNVTGSDILMTEVEAIRFTLYDRATGSLITKISNNIDMIDSVIKASVLYYTQDLCAAECELTKTESGYELKVGSSTGTNSRLNDRFDLKQIDILFKGVVTYD